MRIAIGSDHAGFELKEIVVQALREWGHEVDDKGTYSKESCDYPDLAVAVAKAVAKQEVDRGILICGSGIGMSIAANKVPGIRAALCSEPLSARLTREDNDSNVLTLGARIIGPAMALEIVDVWLKTPYAGGRHQKRLDKISAYEASIQSSSSM